MVSYGWLWHWTQPNVCPCQTSQVVLTLSMSAAMRNSSSSVPPSELFCVSLWNVVAMRSSWVGFSNKSPASCLMVNWSNGMSELNALMSQSRYGQTSRRLSAPSPSESA